ncbi:twin-arginine translocation pathway signal [Buttiauxella noackiae ATCC 51607]|uniref:Twin-arginine translocation pathway signal n=1 Tax=Buttiauxella noackiae ATCC 51607 TaxID=1354255 RepID=A0A1B7HL87_9ENTR|nr:flavodoxin [Buttiauxella noackiae]OAT16404.1 twin-arginine translocation pathway signal [Buttiauxella noackiae ATCC 51607]
MEHDPNRRMLITALAGLTLANVPLATANTGTANVQGKSRVLVAYFSRSGNTRVIAGVIHRSLNTDQFEIEPAMPYPEDYFQTVEHAKNERERGVKPALKNRVVDISRYETVYLGFPIWGTSVPPVVQTFLSSHNLAGKLLIPFITHGGYGKGDSDDILASLAPAARREKPLVIECDQERRTTETVTRWLETIGS